MIDGAAGMELSGNKSVPGMKGEGPPALSLAGAVLGVSLGVSPLPPPPFSGCRPPTQSRGPEIRIAPPQCSG